MRQSIVKANECVHIVLVPENQEWEQAYGGVCSGDGTGQWTHTHEINQLTAEASEAAIYVTSHTCISGCHVQASASSPV
jgi:hypothetical protein